MQVTFDFSLELQISNGVFYYFFYVPTVKKVVACNSLECQRVWKKNGMKDPGDENMNNIIIIDCNISDWIVVVFSEEHFKKARNGINECKRIWVWLTREKNSMHT